MALLRWAFLISVGTLLILVGVANREPVTLRLLPDELEALFPLPEPITVPAFAAIFGGMILGVLVGFFWEWMRERKHRNEVIAKRREVSRLEHEMDDLKRKQSSDEDEILGLLD